LRRVAAGVLRSGRRLKEVDGVTVRVAEEHRPIAPRHVLGLLYPIGHEAFNALLLGRRLRDVAITIILYFMLAGTLLGLIAGALPQSVNG